MLERAKQPALKAWIGVRPEETNKFYEIVPGGLREEALACVDRPHEWDGVKKSGMPAFLREADDARTFNEERAEQLENLSVTLGRPAKL